MNVAANTWLLIVRPSGGEVIYFEKEGVCLSPDQVEQFDTEAEALAWAEKNGVNIQEDGD